MTTLLSRYLAGEHEAVWAELRQREESDPDVRAVLEETLGRVAKNAEVLVRRLESEKYWFYEERPLTHPTGREGHLLAEVESLCGPVPLALRLFWSRVGGVNLTGTHPDWSFTGYADADGHEDEVVVYTDPLVIHPLSRGFLEALQGELECWKMELAENPQGTKPFVLPLAPDLFHKANVSGGVPHGMRLPAGNWEGVFVGEDSKEVPFIDYLRKCFHWAGFPGFADVKERPRHMLERWSVGFVPF